MLKKKINFTKKKKKMLDNYLASFSEQLITKITNRTQRGIDKDGKSFKEYEKSTVKKKGSSIVNLQDTSKMLNSIKSKEIKYGIRFYLEGSRQKGLSNNDVAYYNKKNGREFLGFPKKGIKELKSKLTKIYTKILKP